MKKISVLLLLILSIVNISATSLTIKSNTGDPTKKVVITKLCVKRGPLAAWEALSPNREIDAGKDIVWDFWFDSITGFEGYIKTLIPLAASSSGFGSDIPFKHEFKVESDGKYDDHWKFYINSDGKYYQY